MIDIAEDNSVTNTHAAGRDAAPLCEVSQDVLILRLDDSQCDSGQCSKISFLFGKAGIKCSDKTYTDPQSSTIRNAPRVIVVRSSADRAIAQRVENVKKQWPASALLALLCSGGSNDSSAQLKNLSNGVDDFLSCPYREEELLLRTRRLLNNKLLVSKPSQIQPISLSFRTMVGESPCFLHAVKHVAALARTDAPVLILGETGTGKELFARALHYDGPRCEKPFIAVNCGGIPELLFENELFGHVKGAFTNASGSQDGLIAEAEGGTLFLDEVDTLSPGSQVKLLRFVQSGEYRPLGTARSVTGNVRILAATNTDLRTKVDSKTFRGDLYYRLNVFRLSIPALRERAGDIPLLANYFLNRYATQYGRIGTHFETTAMEKLSCYEWPGNVRELEAVVQRAVVLSDQPELDAEDVDIPIAFNNSPHGPGNFRQAMAASLARFEKTYISEMLAQHHGNLSSVATHSGKHRRTIQRLMRKHGLDRRLFE